MLRSRSWLMTGRKVVVATVMTTTMMLNTPDFQTGTIRRLWRPIILIYRGIFHDFPSYFQLLTSIHHEFHGISLDFPRMFPWFSHEDLTIATSPKKRSAIKSHPSETQIKFVQALAPVIPGNYRTKDILQWYDIYVCNINWWLFYNFLYSYNDNIWKQYIKI